MTDENIEACRGTPAEVGCLWKAEAAGPNPDYVEGSGGYSPGDLASASVPEGGIKQELLKQIMVAIKSCLAPVPDKDGQTEPLLNADDAWLNAHYKAMVDRFLAWRLPHDFCPDAGISFKPNPLWDVQGPHWPAGTNLLHAGQALEMFKHCVDLPPAICQGANCGATNGTDHSPECIVEAAEAQGWADAPEAVEARAKIAAPKLTPADIEGVIVSEHYFTAGQGDMRAVEDAAFSGGVLHASGRATPEDLAHVTFCVLILRNGTKVTGVNHGPVSAANFDAQKGREYARENAIEKVWELEGYLLRERMTQTICITPSDKQKADLVNALRNAPTGALEVAADPDAEKAAKVLSIVRAFVAKHRISFPEVIHQTDRVIENAYELIQDLVDVAGYLPEEDEDDEASA